MKYYLIIINIISFGLFSIKLLMPKKQIDNILYIICLFGGSLGTLVSMLIFDRNTKKDNMMLKIFAICIFIIQIILYMILQLNLTNNFNFSIISFFQKNKFLLIYLGIINLITFGLFALDKLYAIKHKKRIRIITLLGLSSIGGSLGGLVAMYLFRHKINKNYFTVGIPLIIVTQIILLFFVINIS